jgi:hypothetical protein
MRRNIDQGRGVCVGKMKCISVKQPYADFLVSGKKKVVLRGKYTNYRGEVLIHAAKDPDVAACKRHGIDPKTLTHGAIIGKLHLFGVKEYLTEKGFLSDKDKHLAGNFDEKKHRYGLMLKAVEKFVEPIYLDANKGLDFFEAEV